ncbi:serine/threonine protein kinase [Tuwongella immobilis]|uniref:Protein kinase domain-containing protein n=1 Tax=Tuwongella immobilis TaxID=692036 RepID=A0A6C2YJX1_9BACT
MMAQVTVESLVAAIRKSELIESRDLDRVFQRFQGQTSLENPEQFVAMLIDEALITNLQGKLLLEGKSRGFLVNGKYKLLELIAVGGMGAVYLCEHVLMRRLVAMKVLPRENNPTTGDVERFIREARAVASLDHPNIVKAFDLDRIGTAGNHCLILEYVDGPNLLNMVKKSGPLSVDRTVNYIIQTAEGLQHAHQAGWVHRDIKPHNILINRQGMIKILDMGLARLFNNGEGLTEQFDSRKILGTADYIAPEQVTSSSDVDIRADIYSLGATFYYLLTGRPPFDGGTTQDKLMWHQVREPEPVSKYRSDVPKGVVAAIQKMLAKDPRSRFQTPSEVAQALLPWANARVPAPLETELPRFCPLVQTFLNTVDSGRTSSTTTLSSILSRSVIDLTAVETKPRAQSPDNTAVDLSQPTWRGRSLDGPDEDRQRSGGSRGGSGSGKSSGSVSERRMPSHAISGGFFQRNLLSILVVGLLGVALTIAAIWSYQNNRPLGPPPKPATKPAN